MESLKTQKIGLGTGQFIRDYLLREGEAYPHEIYRALKDEKEFRGLTMGSATNFYRYFYILRKLGAVQKTGRTEPSSRSGMDRVYYRVALGFEGRDDIWNNPQKAMYVEEQK